MIERRKHRRIITLKNFGRLLIVMILLFAVLSIDFSGRRGMPGQYGRIVSNEIPRHEAIEPHPQVVTEAPVTDQTAADPLLLAPAAREQEFLSTTTWRTDNPICPGRQDCPPSTIETRGSGVNIVGDSGGVNIVRAGEHAKQPVLAGGIFKQP